LIFCCSAARFWANSHAPDDGSWRPGPQMNWIKKTRPIDHSSQPSVRLFARYGETHSLGRIGGDHGHERSEISEMVHPIFVVLFILFLFLFLFFSFFIELIIFKQLLVPLLREFAKSQWLHSMSLTSAPKSVAAALVNAFLFRWAWLMFNRRQSPFGNRRFSLRDNVGLSARSKASCRPYHTKPRDCFRKVWRSMGDAYPWVVCAFRNPNILWQSNCCGLLWSKISDRTPFHSWRSEICTTRFFLLTDPCQKEEHC
jgi:hypothetical protein